MLNCSCAVAIVVPVLFERITLWNRLVQYLHDIVQKVGYPSFNLHSFITKSVNLWFLNSTIQFRGSNWNVRSRTRQGLNMSRGGDDISRLWGRCAHNNLESREHTCLSSLSKSSGLWAPCVGMILHCLTTSSPCFKTEREEISFLKPSKLSVLPGTQKNSGRDGWW